jgi:Concanavalin A-like lectin/glucanases superfamily
MRKTILGLLVAELCLAALGAAAHAADVAYWRHEGGTNGGLIPAGPDTVLDSSGNGNNMRTFDPAFTSATYTSNVSPVPLRSGLANNLALDFGPGGDEDRFRGGLDDDNFSEGKPINSRDFTAMTVELAFNMNSVEDIPPTDPRLFQALLGKDGQPTAGPQPPFKVLIRGDDFPDAVPNQLFIEWFDGDGDLHFLSSRRPVVAGDWNHVAFTITATDAQMWVASAGGPYTLLDSKTGQDFAGPTGEVLIDSDGNWTIGRGMFGGGITDWSDAVIDEVRIGDTALSPSQFLFAAIPEPSGCLLALVALSGFVCRRPSH